MAETAGGSADEQASAWLARLRSRSVSTAELEEFAEWRRQPANSAAYERAETIWERSGKLSNDPDIQRALHGPHPRRPAATGGALTHPVLAATAGLMLAATLLITTISLRTPAASETYQTAIGERSSVRLSDGSSVQLDTDSAFATRFSANERRITLDAGQAFFDVAHSSDRAFVVDAGHDITITALGTRFDVHRRPDCVIVALVAGSVVVRRAGIELARMRPGSVIAVAIDHGLVATTKTIAEATNWRDARLSFRATPLAEAVAEINRYTSDKLTITVGKAQHEPISGEFSTNDPEGFRRAVNALLGDEVVSR